MSKQVDERVVSMQFDNKNFEKNVSTTMSTLDKLKQKLRFDGASKGLENINAASKKVDMNGLANGVETVRARFSALEVMGVTALANITNSAVNAGKRMISALTLDPIKTGLSEYETQINAVQTILANTKSKGSTLDDVNKALDTLNTYADKTIYNFTQMTRNIGTFTAAGVELQTSVDSIKGISNLAAVSGSSPQQAANAMYQLSQALAAGKVSLMDWNSVVNAGMGGELFQNALIRTSELLKTGAKNAINTYGSFRESLTKGEWLTTEVLTETLKQLSGAYSEADLIAQGFTEKQAKEIATLAEDAANAATEVKDFTQLWGVMKESAQSGWSQTWEIIIGDFEEAKALLSPLAEFFQNVIGNISDARNKLLEGALGKRFGDLAKSISGIAEPVKNTVSAVKDLGDVVNKVILGNFGNGEVRFKALTEAGYNYYRVQNKVNESLNNGFRYTQEQIDAQDKLLGVQTEATETQKELGKTEAERIAKLVELSEEQLKNLGYTEEQIKALKDVKREADKLGMPVQEFIENIDKLNGRSLIIESFKNLAKGLGAALTSVKDGWQKVFPPKSMEEKQQGLYNVIAAFHKFSEGVKTISDEAGKEGSTVDKLRRTFEGLFTAVKMVSTVVGGPIKIAFKVLGKILSMCDLDILTITASIGDAIVGFDKWLSSTFNFTKVFESIGSGIKNAIEAIRDWIDGIKTTEDVPKYIADGIMSGLSTAWNNIIGFISQIGTSISNGFSGVPGDMISGFVNGIWNGIQVIGQVMVELGSQILSKFREVLGIHSPSTETQSDGNNFILGFIVGVKEFASKAWDCIKGFASECAELVGNINWGGIFAGGISIGIIMLVKKISDALGTLAAPFEGVGDVLSGTGKVLDKSAKPIAKILKNTAKVVKSFSKVLNGIAFDMKTEGIKKLAMSIGILVGCIILLTFFDSDKLWESVRLVTALAGVLVALAFITEKMSKASVSIDRDGAKVNNLGKSLVGIATSLLFLAIAMRLIGTMSSEEMSQGFGGLSAAIIGLGIIIGAYGVLVKGKAAQHIDKAGKAIQKIGVAMLLLVVVAKMIAGMSWESMAKASIGITFLGGIITGLIAATKLAGNKINKVGSTIQKIGVAMLLLAVVAKMIGGMELGDMAKAMAGMTVLAGIITGLIAATKLAGKDINKVGPTILSIGAALLLLSVAAKMMGGMSLGSMGKATIGITALAGIITGLIATTKLVGENDLSKVGTTLLLMSVSIGILAGVAIILGTMPVENLVKGVTAVGILSAMMALMIIATKNANDCKSNLIVMTVAIGVMAAAVSALSFIEPTKLAGATVAMSLLMGMFALMAKTAGSAQKSMASLITMTGAILILAGIIYLLSVLPVESTIGSAIALSTLMLAMSGALFVLSKIGGSAVKALLGVVALTAMAVPLLAFVGVLAVAGLVQNATKNAILLSSLTSVLTVLLLPLTLVGTFATSALLGVLALTTMAVPLLAFVGVLAIMQCIGDATKNVLLLSALMVTLTDCLLKVSLVAPLALIGVTAMTTLTVLMVAIGALAVGIGALMETFPQLEEFLNTGIPIIEKLAYAVGSMVGNLVAGFSDALASSLPKLGLSLSLFMINATPFITGIKMVDRRVMDGVSTLSLAILALTAADLISGMSSFLQGGSSFADLGAELSMFMMNAMPFITNAKMIDPKAMQGVKTLADTIMVLTASDLLSGLASWLTGGSSFAEFGTQLAPFGDGIAAFAKSVSGLDESSLTAMNAAAKAGKTLAEMASSLPNSGGLLGGIFGENDMDTFGTQLTSFGTSMVDFANSVKDLNVEAIEKAVPAAKSLSELAASLPNTGGVASFFAGDNDMNTFGSQLVLFGESITTYATSVIDLNTDAIAKSVSAAKSLSDMATNLPDSGGLWSVFGGDNDMKTFGEQLGSFGAYLAFYGDKVASLNTSAISNSVDSAKAISDLAKNLPDAAGWFETNDFTEFGKNLVSFGGSMVEYSNKISEITNLSSLSSATSEFQKVAEMASGITGVDFGGVKSLGESLKSIGSNAVNDFIKAFTDAYGEISKAGSDMITKLVNGVSDKKTIARNAFVTLVKDCIADIKTYYDSFYSTATYLVQGFANGITNNTYLAEAKSREMARAAADAAREELDEHSPSKVGYEIGDFFGVAFVNAIVDYKKKAYNAGSTIANSARSGLSRAMNMVNDILNSDMDSQPTIRPIVDLDNVSAGVDAMNRMFGLQPSMGVLSNVGSINYAMNRRIQNGGNEEVVSAINKLRDDLGSVRGNTYNVNGITYDDGSNVSEAVSSLIRAARVERRV